MYEGYFKLKEQPFGASPDPRFLFRTGSHREASASLDCGFHGNRSFTVLIAEPGMGKTTLLFDFLDRIRDRARTVFLFNTLCEPNDVLSFILYDLGVTPAQTKVERHRQLNDILVAEARIGRRVVVVIDEAQNLSSRTLEAVRLLTNFETSRSKLMHVVLAGQPELADKLAATEATQLFQRVSTLCRLTPFIPPEAAAYIAHRLKVAGHSGSSLFTAGAIHLLTEASHGIPRIINTLCFNSLCLCRARNAKLVDRAIVAEAIADLQLPVTRQLTTRSQPEVDMVSSPSFLKCPEIFLSTSKLAKYLTTAALVICATLAGLFTWHMRVNSRLDSPLPTIISASPKNPGASPAPESGSTVQNLESTKTATPPRETATKASGLQNSETTQPVKITIAAGDTLEGIATAHLGSLDGNILREIQALNPRLTDPNHIETGGTIRLPGRGGPEASVASARLQP